MKRTTYITLGVIAVGGLLYYFRKNIFGSKPENNPMSSDILDAVGYNSSIDMDYADGSGVSEQDIIDGIRAFNTYKIDNNTPKLINVLNNYGYSVPADASRSMLGDLLLQIYQSNKNTWNEIIAKVPHDAVIFNYTNDPKFVKQVEYLLNKIK